MSILLRKTRTGFFMAMIGLLIMSVMAPVLTLANDDLEPGDDAVALRDSYLYSDYRDDANIEAEVAEDTPVTVEDGPLYSPIDGTPWYEVKIFEDRIGYMPGVDLEGETIETAPVEPTDTEATAEEPVEESAPALPWQQPIDFGVASADVTCRGDASTGGAEIMIVASGASIEITGAEVWAEGIGWTPVNCGGVGGFISSDYIARETEEAAPAEEPVVEESAPVEETVVEDPAPVEETVVEDPAPVEETVTEAPVSEAVVSEAPAEAESVTEAAPQTEQAAAEEPVAEEVTEAPVVQPAADPIATAWAADAVNCRIAPTVDAEAIAGFGAGETIAVTGEAFAAEGFTWTPVNCGGVGGFVATDFLTWEDPAAVEAPVEDATGAESTEAAPEQLEQEDTGDESLADEIIDQTNSELEGEVPTADEIIDETNETLEGELSDVDEAIDNVEQVQNDTTETSGIATDKQDTEVPAEVPSSEPTEEEVTAEPTETAAVEEPATEPTEVATEEAVVEEPTEEATAEATEELTEEPAEDATEEATETVEEAPVAESGIAVEETESEVPVEDNAILGTAEVTGTNGLGLACRVAPESGAAVIATLPEGMGVFVLAEPDANGWMSIVCADQVGYAPAHYLYSGGDASEFTSSSPSLGTVSSTAGAGLNCRSGPSTSYSIIGYFPAGSSVNVRGAAQGDWVPVLCGGNQEGWVHGDFVSAASAPSGNTGGNDSSSTGVATVVNTSGDSLRCRSGAGTSYSILTNLAPGSTVNLRSGSQGDWQAVICAGQNGFAHSGFLSIGGGGGSTPDEGSGDSSTPSSGNVTVSGTGGARLNCRTGAGTSFAAVTSVAEGTVLSVRGAAQGGWLPVVCNGQNLWVSADFVTAGGSAPSEPSTPPTNGGGTGEATGTATVVNTSGDSLRCRSGAGTDYSTITFLAAGSTVSLRSGSSGDWQAVICAGQNGFAHSGYLSTGGGSTPDPEPEPEPTPSGFANGDHAKVSSNLNLRYDPYMGNNVAAVAPAGTVVLITGGHAGNSYYPVNWDGLKGYMSGDYLTKTNEALSERGGSAQPTDPPTSGGGGTSTGNAIADYAMGYLGYPYVWATHGPASFDCSGFTYWVIYNVTGKNIWYGLWTQISAGVPVSRGALQPGDLVFFQNTYKAGLSHVGIYIGNNKFIHAQNESTGVVISDLDSSYYGPRWYGARRIH